VFAPPARHLLPAGDDYQAALALVAEEQKTNPQVDEWVRAHPDSEAWLWEGHPELSFLALNDGNSLVGDKRSAAGLTQRLQRLRNEFPDIEDQLIGFEHASKQADVSDVLDAYAALSTALECARGDQEELGGRRARRRGHPHAHGDVGDARRRCGGPPNSTRASARSALAGAASARSASERARRGPWPRRRARRTQCPAR
jgi:hypothetical protein